MYFKRFTFLVCLGTLVTASCSEEQPAAPESVDLTTKESVLAGLQQAYDDQSSSAFFDLLDNFYTFCWQPANEGTECFDRTSSEEIVARFFQSGWYEFDGLDVDQVIVTLSYSGGEPGWIPSTTEKDPPIRIFEKVVDYEIKVRQGGATRTLGGGRTTVFVVAKGNTFRIRGIFDHGGLWGGLHREYESAQ